MSLSLSQQVGVGTAGNVAADPVGTRVTQGVARCQVEHLGRAPLIGLVLLIILAASIRFYGLDREGLWGDEYIQVITYELPPHYTVQEAIGHHGLGPLDFLVGWVIHRIHPTVWAYRLPAAVWGVVGVVACFFLVTRLASWREGLIAAGLLCFCRMHLILSQEARPYSMALAFLLILLILLLRAIEKPTWRRIMLYGFMCYLCPLTRSFTPMVFQTALGIVLGVAFIFAWRTDRQGRSEQTRVLKRLWVATILAGVATLPMLAYSLYSPMTRVYTVLPSDFKQNAWEGSHELVAKLLQNAGTVGKTLLASCGPWVLTLAVVGMLLSMRRWRALPLGGRCVFAVMLLVGPIFVTVFSSVVYVQTLVDRYNFYLMPIAAAFAAIAVVALIHWLSRITHGQSVLRWASVSVLLATVFAYPIAVSADEVQCYRRRDWRGAAAFLEELVTSNDVVAVLSERVFGRAQRPFRGKHDWPREKRPLAEAMWTLATSDSHFHRLIKRTGRCYLVLDYPVLPQAKDAYLSRGLQTAPPGFQLVKFRGLDLLLREQWNGTLLEELLAGCDELLKIPRLDPSTNAVVFALKARILQQLDQPEQASSCYLRAQELVPNHQRQLFEHATATWTDRLSTDQYLEAGKSP